MNFLLNLLASLGDYLYIHGFTDKLMLFVKPNLIVREFPIGCTVRHAGDKTCKGTVIGYQDLEGMCELIVLSVDSKERMRLFACNCEVMSGEGK